MAQRVDVSQYRTFDQICDRLDVIIDAVRDKDTSLERSLDLFDEAIALGSSAVDMVDVTELSAAEEAQLHDAEAQEEAAEQAVSGEESSASSVEYSSDSDVA